MARSPYLHVRIMVGGKRRQFSTCEKSKRAAEAKARAIIADTRTGRRCRKAGGVIAASSRLRQRRIDLQTASFCPKILLTKMC